jgi:hypothetical protein
MSRELRPGWTVREPYTADDGEGGKVPSYEFRLCDDHWVTVHATTAIEVVRSPLGIRDNRPDGYSSLADAMEYAEGIYRESLTAYRDGAARRLAEMEQALASHPAAPQPEQVGADDGWPPEIWVALEDGEVAEVTWGDDKPMYAEGAPTPHRYIPAPDGEGDRS